LGARFRPPARDDRRDREHRQHEQHGRNAHEDDDGDHDLDAEERRTDERHHRLLEVLSVRPNERQVLEVLGPLRAVDQTQAAAQRDQPFVDRDREALPHVPSVHVRVAPGRAAAGPDQRHPDRGRGDALHVTLCCRVDHDLEEEGEQRVHEAREDAEGERRVHAPAVRRRCRREQQAEARQGPA
jgi:hypothetical protein